MRLPFLSAFTRSREDLRVVTRTRHAMATFVTVSVLDHSEERALSAMESAFGEMERLVALFDRRLGSSAVGLLNAEGRLPDPPPELDTVLETARALHGASQGAFDITVAPLVDLHRIHFRAHGEAPSPDEIQKVRPLVDASGVRREGALLRLATEGMAITLDGIAKGHVVDCMTAALKAAGMDHGLVNAGGDIRAFGGRGRRPWRIDIQDPLEPDGSVGRVEIVDGAVATSGNYEVFFDRDKRHHHTIAPETGSSPPLVASVTVRAPTATEADALATAVFVLGPSRGLGFIESWPNASVLVITSDGARLPSRLWRQA